MAVLDLWIPEVPELLVAADKAGFDKPRVRREYILLDFNHPRNDATKRGRAVVDRNRITG